MIAAHVVKSPKELWELQKARLKAQFPKLTAEDLNFDESKRAEFFRHLEPKLAMTAEELTLIMESL
jgi:hypothetical protein